MNIKKESFINFVTELINTSNKEMPEEAQSYWEALKVTDGPKEKPMFTENGKLILQYLQENSTVDMWKAKDIAEGLLISSRTVSGSMRKLITDGFIEKIGKDPTIYSLTQKGKEIEIK